MCHQFKVYIKTINKGIIERYVNCVDSFSAIMIATAIYNGEVLDTEMVF